MELGRFTIREEVMNFFTAAPVFCYADSSVVAHKPNLYWYFELVHISVRGIESQSER